MSSTQGQMATSSIRRHTPQVKLPHKRELARLSAPELEALEACLEEQAECVFDPCFEQPDAENNLLGPLPDNPDARNRRSSDDSGFDLQTDTTGRALSPEQEQHLFRRLNYCRYRVLSLLRNQRGKQLAGKTLDELLLWYARVRQIRADIVRLNVALVMAMAKRTRLIGIDHSDLISEGNLALLRSVDKFDCARGFKFSTYACRAILKSFSRVATRTARYRGYFPTEFDPALEKGDYLERKRRDVESDCVDELKSILGQNLARLNDVEERVIRARFALDDEVTSADVTRGQDARAGRRDDRRDQGTRTADPEQGPRKAPVCPGATAC